MKFKVNLAGIEKELEVTRQADQLRITFDGTTTGVRVVYTEGAHFVLEYDQPAGEFVQRRRLRAAGHLQGVRRQLWVNGSNLDYTRVRPQAAGGAAGTGSLASSIQSLAAELPGAQIQRQGYIVRVAVAAAESALAVSHH